jgi:3-hydroxyisobutyrate dehydrogenase
MTRIALLGVGTMGRHLLRHLTEAGHEMRVYDPSADAMTYAASLGADTSATSAAEACAGVEVALLSLPSPALVAEVAAEAGAALDPGSLLADLSTSPPALARELAETWEARGLLVCDCPLSGGPIGAEAGTLSSMVGGSDEAFARMRPVAEAFSAYVVHVGPAGTGQAAKLCNNLLAGTHMAAHLAARLVQGAAGACVNVSAFALVMEVSTDLARDMGVQEVVVGAGFMLGPT